jgi:single-stranded-DNA-specific exonuclease
MSPKWIDPPELTISPGLLALVGGSTLAARALAHRGIENLEIARAFLNPNHHTPSPPKELPDLPQAVERLLAARERGEQVCVWGDFDVDGQTATAVLVEVLRALGLEVTYYIPSRLREGHGVHKASLEEMLSRGVDLLLTCDTGIEAHDAVAQARERQVEIIVTDHHDLPEVLPPALAVVNPKRLSEAHPLRELPGVGVAYKLAEGLCQALGRQGETERVLEMVALGIVTDLAYLSGDTRYLLQRGLERLRRTERLGLRELIQRSGLEQKGITEHHVGFWLGPRLNSLGRLGDANLGVEFLITDSLERARVLSVQVEGLNDQRRLLMDRTMREAEAQLEEAPSFLDYEALVLLGPEWHPGVLGLVASRLAEKHGKPTVVLSLGEAGFAQGSARSVPGVDIHAAILQQSALLERSGGHPMAAGLALREGNVPALRKGLSEAVSSLRDRSVDALALAIDAYLDLEAITPELADEIGVLAPFGPGNLPVQLASRNLRLGQVTPAGRNGEHRRVTVRNEGGNELETMWWRGAQEQLPGGDFDLAFQVKATDYRGERRLLVEWVDYRQVEAPAVKPPLQIVDHRSEPEPVSRLRELLAAHADVQVWGEGRKGDEISVLNRNQLAQGRALVIWTAPPGPDVLQAALAAVDPREVYLFGRLVPQMDAPRSFLQQIEGVIKYSISKLEGSVDLPQAAAALGHRVAAVRLGVDYWAGRGALTVVEERDTYVLVREGGQAREGVRVAAAEALRSVLNETAAYRRHFQGAPTGRLL